MRRYRRAGYAGVVAAAAAAMAVAGCSSSSSSGSSSAVSSSAASASASSPASSPSAVSTASGSGGLGKESVTNYLSYVGGKSGPANNSLSPVTIGYVNEQGDANPPGLLATTGAEMAVKYINAELGGVDGHPLKLDTCFIASEEQGTTCADQFLANKSIPLIATGGVAVGAQPFYSTLAGKLPVINGVAVTPYPAVQKNTVILFGDSTHVLGPMGTYAKDVLHAKTAVVIYPQTAGLIPGAQAIQKGLQAAGVSVKMAPYPVSATNLTSVLASAGASSAGMVVPYADATDCVNLAKALQQQGITNPEKIVSAPLCLSSTVLKGLGDYPKWTYSIASSLYGDKTDPGMPAYEKVTAKYTTPADAGDPWVIVNFGEILTVDKILNQLGYGHITSAAVLKAAKAFTGPQALGAPSLDCGKYPSAPGVCNDRAQFFEYHGGIKTGHPDFTKVAGWLQPPS